MPETPARIEPVLLPSEKPFVETRQTLHLSLLSRGMDVRQKILTQKDTDPEPTQSELDLNGYAFFATMPTQPEGKVVESKPLWKEDPSTAMRMIVTVDDKGKMTPHAFLKKGEASPTLPQGGRLITLQTTNGKVDGHFRFGTTDNEVIDIREQDFFSLYSYTYQDSLKSTLTDAETQVADVVFAHIRDPKRKQTVDRDTLSEAIRASGQISTEPVLSCVQLKMPKKDVPPDPAAGATPEEIESHKIKKDQVDAHNTKLDQLVAGLQDHVIATRKDLSTLLSLFGENELRAETANQYAELLTLREQRQTATNSELKTRLDGQIAAIQEKILEYDDALKTITDPKKLEIFFGLIESGKLSPEAAKAIGDSFAKGEVGEAMKKMAQENLASMSQEEQEKISKFLGKDVKEIEKALMTAGGAGLILLLLLIISGAGGAKG
ncbi:hypothetical protein COU87_04380 [Candidatus Roizmanbacteria bacterium CG10_big_fil_rev_8_21_14_0_10_39_12]|uniref:Uncharacterized protein n=1 Tax=Candidatus Roizmanbacteria bacterium CG10_big_fil_rev_8_21_14_0_10_39_12 TaxID=1974852 RepID=A0A2M8KNK4_9BACT|nr:MAG: hypothetical protein COU87_04380 [Candidatus Roizmanbacteria bacterium CG10_big_fil_rev_8_21_14_0_10_39_12]